MAARHEEGCYEKKELHRIFSCFAKDYIERLHRGGKGHRVSGDTGGSAGFKTGDFVNETLGGATVVRLLGNGESHHTVEVAVVGLTNNVCDRSSSSSVETMGKHDMLAI